jgi:adenylate cyclase
VRSPQDQPKKKRKSASALIFLILIAAAAAVLLLALSGTGVVRTLENRTIDYRFAARGARVPVHPAIKIIALDDETFEKMSEPFTIMAARITDVAEKIVRAGARVTGIDGIQEISLESFVPGQTRRMQLLAASGRVVLISYLRPDGTRKYPIAPITAVAGLENVPPSNLAPDEDEVIRRHPIHLEDAKGAHLPTFPIVVAARFMGGELESGSDGRYRIASQVIRDEGGYVAVNYAGPPGTFPVWSFYEVLGRARRNEDAWFKKNFENAVVLISRTDAAGKDWFETPFNVRPGGQMSGVEICANVINTILQGRFLSFMRADHGFPILFLMCCITALSCYYLRPLPGTLLALGSALGYTWLDFFLFTAKGYVMSLALPVAAVPLSYGATFVYRYLTVDRRMRKIRETFGKLVSRPVEEDLWKENIEPRPGSGSEKRVTVLFSDINDFTPTCLGRSPTEVITMLNDYYTEMVDIAFRNKGMLLHFVGDEIITAHGASIDEPHQALLSVRTAVEMIRRLRALEKEKSDPGFYGAKIGINTGLMVVGFLGSMKRMEFTAIGESVNIAARIEALNKRLGSEILISEATYKELLKVEGENLDRVLPGVEFLPLEPQEIKGYEKKIMVYEVKVKEAC